MLEIIYENPDWLPFFEEALKEEKIPYRLNFIDTHEWNPSTSPDPMLYLNRISPSSHTRGHHNAVEKGRDYLTYLSAHHSAVLNPLNTLQYEMSKVAQYQLLEKQGLRTPKTVSATDRKPLLELAKKFPFPLMTKHNCSGKGLGIKLFDTYRELENYLHSEDYIPSPDGILLLQEYIQPKGDRITRVEVVDGKLLYALHSSTAQGFELCPADACNVERRGLSQAVCEVGGSLFTYIPDFQHEVLDPYLKLARENHFDLVGIEFVEDENGVAYTYDINLTTNYSPDVEKTSGHEGKKAFQRMIKRRLGE